MYCLKTVNCFYSSSKTPSIILICSKCDLINQREITRRESMTFAKSLNCNLYEVSAREYWTKQISVNKPFKKLSFPVKQNKTKTNGSRLKRWSSYCTLRPTRVLNRNTINKDIQSNEKLYENTLNLSCSSDSDTDDFYTDACKGCFAPKISPLVRQNNNYKSNTIVQSFVRLNKQKKIVNNCKNIRLVEKDKNINYFYLIENDVNFIAPFEEALSSINGKNFSKKVKSRSDQRSKSPNKILRSSLRKMYKIAASTKTQSIKSIG